DPLARMIARPRHSSNDIPVRVEADRARAAGIDDKDILVLRACEVAGRGGVESPHLKLGEQPFVPGRVLAKVRGSHVVVNEQGSIRRIRFCQFSAEQVVIAGPGLWLRVRATVTIFAISPSTPEIAPTIIWRQDFGSLDKPIGRVRREICLKIRLRWPEFLSVLRRLPTRVGQRPGEIRENEPLE